MLSRSDILRLRLDGCTALDLSGHGLRSAKLSAFLDYPGLGTLQEIDLRNNEIGDPGARMLATHPRVTSALRVLRLSRNGIGPNGVLELATSKRLVGIEELDLSENPLGDAGLALLGENASWPHLRRLDVGGCEGGPTGMRALAVSRELPRLETLSLYSRYIDKGLEPLSLVAFSEARGIDALRAIDLTSNRRLTLGDVEALVNGPHAPGLAALYLRGLHLGPGLGEILGGADELGALRELDLSWNDIGAKGAASLAGSKLLQQLASLRIGNNGIDDEALAALVAAAPRECRIQVGEDGIAFRHLNERIGVRTLLALLERGGQPPTCDLGIATPEELGALLASPLAARLKVLSLRSSRLDAANAGAFAVAPLGALERLSLVGCGLDADLVARMFTSAHLPSLRELDLQQNALGATGATLLASCPVAKSIRELNLAFCNIGEEGCHALVQSPWPCLRHLNLRGNAIGVRGAQALAAWSALERLESLELYDNGLQPEEIWTDWNGAIVGGAPGDDVVARIRARVQGRVWI